MRNGSWICQSFGYPSVWLPSELDTEGSFQSDLQGRVCGACQCILIICHYLKFLHEKVSLVPPAILSCKNLFSLWKKTLDCSFWLGFLFGGGEGWFLVCCWFWLFWVWLGFWGLNSWLGMFCGFVWGIFLVGWLGFFYSVIFRQEHQGLGLFCVCSDHSDRNICLFSLNKY